MCGQLDLSRKFPNAPNRSIPSGTVCCGSRPLSLQILQMFPVLPKAGLRSARRCLRSRRFEPRPIALQWRERRLPRRRPGDDCEWRSGLVHSRDRRKRIKLFPRRRCQKRQEKYDVGWLAVDA